MVLSQPLADALTNCISKDVSLDNAEVVFISPVKW